MSNRSSSRPPISSARPTPRLRISARRTTSLCASAQAPDGVRGTASIRANGGARTAGSAVVAWAMSSRATGASSLAELGRRVNLSSPAVAERVQRLERAGVITGYRAEIDPRALGYALTAIVRIKPGPGQLQRIPELALEIPEVGECHRITVEDCFYLKA